LEEFGEEKDDDDEVSLGVVVALADGDAMLEVPWGGGVWGELNWCCVVFVCG
jgi:hypothetical protein